jgi:hypothetical protein
MRELGQQLGGGACLERPLVYPLAAETSPDAYWWRGLLRGEMRDDDRCSLLPAVLDRWWDVNVVRKA